MEFANLLKNAGPWGQQFPEPVFEHVFEVIQQRIVGEKHLKHGFKFSKTLLIDTQSGRHSMTTKFTDQVRIERIYSL